MHILIVSQYFWPENFRINDLVMSFLNKGHEVTVLTGLPNYPEGDLHSEFKKNPVHFSDYHGAKIIRVPHVLRGKKKFGLVLNYVTFFVSASVLGSWKLRKNKVDIIFVFAVSPITMAIPAIVVGKLKRVPIFLWVQDLWPETLAVVGAIKSRIVLNLVGRLVRWIYTKCDHILIQSRAFLPSIATYCSAAHQVGKVLYFPNWAESVYSQPTNLTTAAHHPILERDDRYFTILFAGNIGDAQDFPSILDAAEKTKNSQRIRWVIVGDGRAFDWVHSEVNRRGLAEQVKLLGRFAVEAMPAFFAAADVLLVTLKSSDLFARTVPAKLQSYMAAGKPILCMLDGEGRRIVDESGGGVSCSVGDSTQLAQSALTMSQLKPADLTSMGERGRQYYQRHFDRDTLMTQLEQYFHAAISGQILSDQAPPCSAASVSIPNE